MKFGVIQCPLCKTAKGIVLGTKTTSCPRCQKSINLKKARVLFRVDSESELARVVGEVNTQVAEGESQFQSDLTASKEIRKENRGSPINPRDPLEDTAGRTSGVRARSERLIMCARELSQRTGEFTQEEFLEVVKRAGIGEERDTEKFIKWLLENDVIYEPRAGKYRYLGD